MDNKINEIRRKISVLRAEMTLVEAAIREQVNRDLDCSEASYRLMAMRAEVAELIKRWRAAGGDDRLPTVRERLSRTYRDRLSANADAKAIAGVKPDKGKPSRVGTGPK
ncbi:hypothetical protein [Bradyrhizobium sp. CCBAU 51753]|uniref:hypothetical protein n=1 Tax=Bradyrhizobium sp. CCBAU 51753 TaxID=1325100 RepID=UPI00188C76B7|nr:hypothetical protein [Bradyrhizobium sp. CCBAU 51753]QOZ26004.1 hypothetical protein XH93_22165 [Bradyrhizobium sp. CCBAU 51753]